MQILAILLQILLHKFKQILVPPPLQVIPIHIRILKHLPTPNYLINRLLQKLQLILRVRLNPMQQLHLLLNNRPQLPTLLLCLIMVVVPLKVKHILAEFALSLAHLRLLVSDILIPTLLHLLVLVAVVVTTSFLTVLAPKAKT